jgi:HD superfamily phosphohydrolase
LNKKKIINDPVYGFISIPSALVFDLIQHRYFQRLRNIRQLGMTYLVYPGAMHSRFHHALGAMHLMGLAIETLRSKGHAINHEEEEAATIAILLHDIGHGPFSHALEHTLVEGIPHEDISALMMRQLNTEFGGRLDMAIRIFNGQYSKPFLHQLISGQLDLDRMDYLNRDSFFTGVSEGVISFDRIIKMLNIHQGNLVVEEKGIYSIEKFLIARRLMYWQVYLHKTVIAAENMLVKVLERAKELASAGQEIFSTPCLAHFLHNHISREDFLADRRQLDCFSDLDDHDILTSIKVWANHPDQILSTLCSHLIRRDLYQVEISNEPPQAGRVDELVEQAIEIFDIDEDDTAYFVFTDTIKNNAYRVGDGSINILMKDGSVQDITTASDNSTLEALARTVKKYVLCYVKDLKPFA